jgi:hypothetical protein
MAVDLDDLLDRAASVMAELAELDAHQLTGDQVEQVMAAVPQMRGRLDTAEAGVLDRWRIWGLWRASGAKSAAARLASQQRLPIQIARQRLRHARSVRRFPAIASAWRHGDIDRSHIVTLLGAHTPRTRAAFDRFNGEVVNTTLRLIEKELFDDDSIEAALPADRRAPPSARGA